MFLNTGYYPCGSGWGEGRQAHAASIARALVLAPCVPSRGDVKLAETAIDQYGEEFIDKNEYDAEKEKRIDHSFIRGDLL